MELSHIAAYFARTPVDGWNGSAWVSAVTYGSLQPFDRFISERPFGLKRRYLLVDPAFPISATYAVIRVDGVVYLVGTVNRDMVEATYSLVYLVHTAPFDVKIISLLKTVAASGVTSILTSSVVATMFGDTERVSYQDSREYSAVRFPEYNIVLPFNAVVNPDDELEVGGLRYDVREVTEQVGFVYARGPQKR